MRRAAVVLLVQIALLGSVSTTAMEVDGDVMRSIDETVKSLDSNVTLHDVKAASAEAKELAELFVQIEAHYAKKGDAADAVEFSRQTRLLVAQTLTALLAQDFDTAADAVGALTKSCKTCHNVYKKE